MNQTNKDLILDGPYKLDQTTTNVICVRGTGDAIIAKCAPGTYNRRGVTQITYPQAEAHATLLMEALQVFALSGKSPMEMHSTLERIYA